MSIRMALECPTPMLEMVQPFADFDFLLAHLYLKDETYRKHYLGSKKVKILDNSTNELGEPCSLEDIKKVADEVNPNYVVAPDWVGFKDRTVAAWKECVKLFGEDRVIPVIQGSSFEEAIESITAYGKGLIAVPYDICSRKTDPPLLMGLRRALLVCNIPQTNQVHLLGLNSLDELWWYTNKPNVVSIDTGVPILLGLQGKDILDPLESKAAPTYNEMEGKKLDQKSWTAICRNVALLRRYL